MIVYSKCLFIALDWYCALFLARRIFKYSKFLPFYKSSTVFLLLIVLSLLFSKEKDKRNESTYNFALEINKACTGQLTQWLQRISVFVFGLFVLLSPTYHKAFQAALVTTSITERKMLALNNNLQKSR
ncbi:hypothetical protein EDC96DRAFT_545552 [Choanephora cucurbitarum]|nr:hypothetical protein EDC96DRAFT_545552 [Choanephora cucurbitarum]